MANLTEYDVQRLLDEPTAAVRAEAVAKVADLHRRRTLTASERSLAEEIFRIMVHDADASVRAALSEHLKHNPAVPHDVAMELARDVEEVAAPMLHFSLVFSDKDLIDLIRTRSHAHQQAIAGRAAVSEAVASEIVDHGDAQAVTTLVRNPGAEVSERVGAKIIDLFSGSELVMDEMAQRPALPPKLAERMVTLVSENMRLHLAAAAKMPPAVSERLIALARERATLDLLPADAPEHEVVAFVEQLHLKDRLTPSLLLRALCTGEPAFFEAGLAQLCDIPMGNARQLVHDDGSRGLPSICMTASLPEQMFPAVRLAVDTIRETAFDGAADGRPHFRHSVVDAFALYLKGVAPDSVESLLARLDSSDYMLANTPDVASG